MGSHEDEIGRFDDDQHAAFVARQFDRFHILNPQVFLDEDPGADLAAHVVRRRGENDLIVDACRVGDFLQQVAFVAVQRPFVEFLDRYDVGVERLDHPGEVFRVRLRDGRCLRQ